MQVSVDVSADVRSEADAQGLPVIDYIEMLIERGRQAIKEETGVSSAIERIRALRSPSPPPRC
jgi:hypothetical protein